MVTNDGRVIIATHRVRPTTHNDNRWTISTWNFHGKASLSPFCTISTNDLSRRPSDRRLLLTLWVWCIDFKNCVGRNLSRFLKSLKVPFLSTASKRIKKWRTLRRFRSKKWCVRLSDETHLLQQSTKLPTIDETTSKWLAGFDDWNLTIASMIRPMKSNLLIMATINNRLRTVRSIVRQGNCYVKRMAKLSAWKGQAMEAICREVESFYLKVSS